MAYTTIDNPTNHFTTVLTTSTGSALTIDTGFKPDWLWTKARNFTRSNELHDTSRGDDKRLKSDAETAEESYSSYLAFTSTGATLGTNHNLGYHTEGATTGVCWAWKANGGTATATGSESGNDPAYSVQANQTAGFSIITYTGTGAEGDVTHGLGGKPELIITKNRTDSSTPWVVWHKDIVDADADNGGYLYLNTNGQDQTTSVFYEGDAISSTKVAFKGGNANVNADTKNYVMYCFRSIQGYSKFGKYKGNGNANGSFIYTGFKPAFMLFKKTSGADNWGIFDNKRNTETGNPRDIYLLPSATNADSSESDSVDFLSNGFKWRISSGFRNEDGESYIYWAFAENPFVSSKGVVTTAG